jgi:hypothetical protein
MKESKKAKGTVCGLILIFLAATFAWAQRDSQSAKTTYRRNGGEGSLAGTISLSGIPPDPKRIDASADPICYEANPDPLTEYFVGAEGRLANVLVYVKSGAALESLNFETPATNVVLEQRGCQFIPHVLGLQLNQTLEVRNGDRTTQNVHATPKNNPDRNQSQAPFSEPVTMRFGNPEVAIPIKDNQHPWKKAYVGVFTHPFFSVSDRKGAFTIEGLPPGNYTIGAWHEEFGEKTFEVTIYPGSPQSLDISFDVADSKFRH